MAIEKMFLLNALDQTLEPIAMKLIEANIGFDYLKVLLPSNTVGVSDDLFNTRIMRKKYSLTLHMNQMSDIETIVVLAMNKNGEYIEIENYT